MLHRLLNASQAIKVNYCSLSNVSALALRVRLKPLSRARRYPFSYIGQSRELSKRHVKAKDNGNSIKLEEGPSFRRPIHPKIRPGRTLDGKPLPLGLEGKAPETQEDPAVLRDKSQRLNNTFSSLRRENASRNAGTRATDKVGVQKHQSSSRKATTSKNYKMNMVSAESEKVDASEGKATQRAEKEQIDSSLEHSDPTPSASVLLISPTNEILMIHRVETSSSFPSAHVFPGGNVDPQDGTLPDAGLERHKDSLPYRRAAIRELFEESGILLAKLRGSDQPLKVTGRDIARGRRKIRKGDVKFETWLGHMANTHSKGKEREQRVKEWVSVILDTDGLIPFTHWITPTTVLKRFTTQMYLYFVPLNETRGFMWVRDRRTPVSNQEFIWSQSNMLPSSDGGIENTAAEFAPARRWLERANSGEIILFPPQYLLLHLISKHLDPPVVKFDPLKEKSIKPLKKQRQRLMDFIRKDGDPPWTSKFISPTGLMLDRKDGRKVLALDKPGLELNGYPCKGDSERVVLVKFEKEGPRNVEVRWKKKMLEETKKSKAKRKGQSRAKL